MILGKRRGQRPRSERIEEEQNAPHAIRTYTSPAQESQTQPLFLLHFPPASMPHRNQISPHPAHSPIPRILIRKAVVDSGVSRLIVGACQLIVRQVRPNPLTWSKPPMVRQISPMIWDTPCERGASEIIAYPPGFEGFLAGRLSLPTPIQKTFKIPRVSPAPRVADKIGREAR